MPSLASVVRSHKARRQRRPHGRRSPLARLAPLASRRSHRGGRVVAVAGHPTEPMDLLLRRLRRAACGRPPTAAPTGRTSPTASSRPPAVGALAVAPSAPNVIYAGTGEACIRGNVSHGDGVYRSDDGGHTWTQPRPARHAPHRPRARPSARSRHRLRRGARPRLGPEPRARRLPLARRRADVGARRCSRASGPARSISRWTRSNPRVLYAAIWQAQRTPWGMTSGGPESGAVAVDRRRRHLDRHQPRTRAAARHARADRRGRLARPTAAASRRSSRPRMARCSARTTPAPPGSACSEQAGLRGRPWYYMHVFADPADVDTVWVADYSLWKSSDGGKTFVEMATPHGDNHDLWIDPANPRRMIEGNDGGACVSFNGGQSWSTHLQPADRAVLSRVRRRPAPLPDLRLPAGQLGDEPTQPVAPRRHHRDRVDPAGGGESGYIAVKPGDPEHGGGRRRRQRAGHGPTHPLRPPHGPGAHRSACGRRRYGMGTPPGRAPLPLPVDLPHLLLAATTRASCGSRATASSARSTRGRRWEVVSADLTRNDPDQAGSLGRVRSPATTAAPRSTARSSRSPSRRTSATCCGPARTTGSCTCRVIAGGPGSR